MKHLNNISVSQLEAINFFILNYFNIVIGQNLYFAQL